ncbi:hypothetical protein P3T76_007131 [Phytophthora citrophthora]|uniref:Uncharacterized protein n=1 Tax=Phytophthora citrophthora TaxID=4793 RepID=A0AAD9GMQ4_9STRA|nr:hypothetical protein P3T76_007131 [Phytophthora citrophthora]
MHHPLEDLGCPRQRMHQTLSSLLCSEGSNFLCIGFNMAPDMDAMDMFLSVVIDLAIPRDIQSTWRRNQKVLLILWKVQTAIVFHADWRVRNDIYFRQTLAQTPNIANLQNSFKKHCQFIYHHAVELDCDRSTLEKLTRKLGFKSTTDIIPERTNNIWVPQV